MAGARAEVLAVGMTSAVGLSAAETAASVRAGISGARATELVDLRDEPVVVAHVPEAELAEVVEDIERRFSLTERQTRMVSLGGPALAEVLEVLALAPRADGARVPLFVAAPDPLEGEPTPAPPELVEQLALQAGAAEAVDLVQSRLFFGDRAGGVEAIAHALARFEAGDDRVVVVGGVDSLLDQRLLEDLDEEGRLKALGVYDGFLPGEAAAFLALGPIGAARRLGLTPLAVVDAAAVAREPGHRRSAEPYRGDGLAAAFGAVLAAAPAPVRTVYAGLNGESFGAKELGVAMLRHADRIDERAKVEHPAEYLGDVGAAMAPALAVLAVLGMERGYRASPCLVYGSSDGEARGAALLRREPGS